MNQVRVSSRRIGRSAYGLDTGREVEDWRQDSACRNYNPDWWTPITSSSLEAEWAAWVCENECPVKAQCDRWARANMHLCAGAIYAGTVYVTGGSGSNRHIRPSEFQPAPRRPGTKPQARGLDNRVDELRELAATPLTLRDIADRMGYSAEAIRMAFQRHGIGRAA